MTAPMVDYKIHWLKMMSVPESRAVVGRHDGINGRDNTLRAELAARGIVVSNYAVWHFLKAQGIMFKKKGLISTG